VPSVVVIPFRLSGRLGDVRAVFRSMGKGTRDLASAAVMSPSTAGRVARQALYALIVGNELFFEPLIR
jgi:hypothetical protein